MENLKSNGARVIILVTMIQNGLEKIVIQLKIKKNISHRTNFGIVH